MPIVRFALRRDGTCLRLRRAHTFACERDSGENLQEVKRLSSKERQKLWQRVAAEEASERDEWERQVAHDSTSGKLDHLLAELQEDIAAGRVKPLDEVIHEP